MTNYTRSRALSNAVVDISVDQPLHVEDNLGRQSWDTPHRLLSWGYLPAWNPSWAFAYLLDVRSGIPFSVVRDTGEVVGAVNSQRFLQTSHSIYISSANSMSVAIDLLCGQG